MLTQSTLLYLKSLKPGGYLNLQHISLGRLTVRDQQPMWLVGSHHLGRGIEMEVVSFR